ncbi:multicopper oxidase domain-containing protein [Daejeonia sp. YH14]|uniref:multicopper oxidase domain-containing protein n=1 Tax=Daejeonia sp. YH14 TaxID=3439042 RepID=UPI003F497BB2
MRLFYSFLFLLFSTFSFAQTEIQAASYYTCPMHPQVKEPKPGKCPICGMDLVLSDAQPQLKPENTGGRISFGGKTVRYDLYVRDSLVNFTGRSRHAIAINGKLQAPSLYFTEGDTAEIYLHNMLKENTSLHWHGVVLPNEMDGVPYLTTKPTKPGETQLYKFKVSQNGTYWYHSHNGLQEQIGMNGVLIFRKRNSEEENQYKADIPVLLGDWTDERPGNVMRRLHMANTDWYAIKKNYVQSYAEAIKTGNFGTKLLNEWKRMEAMDVSDVYYNAFLINGAVSSSFPGLKAGDKVRLRIVNGASSTYFWVNFGGGKFKVIASDGNDVVPVETDRLIVGNSESYDIEITLPENKSFELRATSEDRTGYASLWLGSGSQVPAQNYSRLKIFEGMKMMNGMMKMSGNMKPMTMTMGNQMMDMNEVMYPEIPESRRKMVMKHMKEMMQPSGQQKSMKSMDTMNSEHETSDDIQHTTNMDDKSLQRLTYDRLQSADKTILPDDHVRILHFTLEGSMSHYLWTLDNKTVTESDKILIRKGEVLRIVLYNNSMMRHPMHLHGHDFRLVNSAGDYAPLKNVIDISPMETDTIEFAANQDGDWFFHCHILYHMMSGMGRVFSYQNSEPNPQLPDKKKAWNDFLKENFMVNSMAMADISSNQLHAETMTMAGARWAMYNEFHSNWNFDHYEGNFKVGRFLGKFQWAYPYAGFRIKSPVHKNGITWFGQNLKPQSQNVFIAGMRYVLPWLVVADASIDQNGKVVVELGREDIPVSRRIRGMFSVSSDREFSGGMRYIVSKWLGISANYDSENKWGAGLTLMY